ncbi:MAG: hypothetical protein AMXMBFR61_02930 [Fimbriimonadales bacterium]
MNRSRLSAFTLIELLVVIAIIAVLAAILLPVFSRAREHGKQVVCGQQMRQVGMAIAMYYGDHDDVLPITWLWDRPWCADNASWKQITKPYQKADELYSCPSFEGKGWDCRDYYANPQVKFLGQYGINNWAYIDVFTNVNPNVADYQDHKTARVNGVEVPSETIIVTENGDGDWIAEPEAYKCMDTTLGTRIFTADYGIVKYRHGGKKSAMVAFVDGHAKVMTRDQLHADNCYVWWRKKR